MANIKVNDIKPAGTDLFADDESFLKELSGDEIGIISGGIGLEPLLSGNNSNTSNTCNSNTSYTCGGAVDVFQLVDHKHLSIDD
ncbi:MAG: hypothetical protein QNJ63_21845 [Calothrix sp. MO_192.B10]|nr:hypothetical protein [Calothrix sp. MO_192.B10]